MNIESVVTVLGIEDYPPMLDEIFADADVDLESKRLLEEDFIREISKKYNVLREREEEFLRLTALVKEDAAAVAWLNACHAYLEKADGNTDVASALKMPKKAKVETTVDIFPMLVLLPQIEKTYERYLKKGLSSQEAMALVGAFGFCFVSMSDKFDKTFLPLSHYHWLCLYYGASLINVAGFNFEIAAFKHSGVYLKNKHSGKLVGLIVNQDIHRSGLILGAAGATDTEGAWFATFTETEDAFIGYPASETGLVTKEEQHYPKADWEKLLQKGDDCIYFHIPRGTDFSPANLDNAFQKGIAAVKKYFPEKNFRCIACGSWLVSPQLREIMKPTANIVAFGKRFTTLPLQDGGNSAISMAFPKPVKRYADLPEDTSLQRSIKKLYMNGGFIHSYLGVFEIKD